MGERSAFITFEGNEGAGKTTQIQLLSQKLQAEGHSVLHVREPGGTEISEQIREIIKHPKSDQPMASETELLLLAASRAQLVQEKILPALRTGTIVLCDRFTDSTKAYQGFGRGLESSLIDQSIQMATSGLEPDLTLYLHLPREASLARLNTREKASDRIEAAGNSFFEKVIKGFDTLAAENSYRIKTINADNEIDSVASEIWAIVSKHLNQVST